jgi:hypothetical protein
MPKDEIKTEINKVLDQFSDKTLEGVLGFLKNLEEKYTNKVLGSKTLDQLLNEDKDLLDRLDK